MSDVPNEKPIPPPPEIAENIDALAEVKIPTTVSDGIYKNLVSQIDSILKHSNERSIKSRYRSTKPPKDSADSWLTIIVCKSLRMWKTDISEPTSSI